MLYPIHTHCALWQHIVRLRCLRVRAQRYPWRLNVEYTKHTYSKHIGE